MVSSYSFPISVGCFLIHLVYDGQGLSAGLKRPLHLHGPGHLIVQIHS